MQFLCVCDHCHYLMNGNMTAFILSSELQQDNNNNAASAAVSLLLVSAIQG